MSLRRYLFAKFYDFFEFPLEKFWFEGWRKKYLSKLHGKILEVGFGSGKNLRFFNSNAEVYAIDNNENFFNKIKSGNQKVKFFLMDAEKMTFKKNLFDYVISTFTLCSVSNPLKVLKEMKRVLKPGGRIILLEHTLSKHKFVALVEKFNTIFTKRLYFCNQDRNLKKFILEAGLEIEKQKHLALFDVFNVYFCKKN